MSFTLTTLRQAIQDYTENSETTFLNGVVTLGNSLSVNNEASIGNGLSVNGAVNISSSLSVGEEVKAQSGVISNGLSVSGLTNLSTLSVGENTFIKSSLSVGEESYFTHEFGRYLLLGVKSSYL